jgi:hypothetical protein
MVDGTVHLYTDNCSTLTKKMFFLGSILYRYLLNKVLSELSDKDDMCVGR